MTLDPSQIPDDIDALKAALADERLKRIAEAARAARVEAELARARAKASDDEALIAHQNLQIEKLRRELYGPLSERTSRILDQMELQLEELESSATEDEIAAERAATKPRERVLVPGPTTCLCCGGGRLRKLGETVSETPPPSPTSSSA